MDPIADAAIPIVTFLMMVAVGHGLTTTDLRRSATDLRAVITATVSQLILLPLIATVIILVFEPAPTVIAGLVLVAACPGGTISNFYTCLAHANAALSLTLTAVSCLLSFITLPILVTAGFFFWGTPTIQFSFGEIGVFDLIGLAISLLLVLIYIFSTIRRAKELSTIDRPTS